MGLFLGPFSGNAVGGGGHGVLDPPPPGTGDGAGGRSEVDSVNRTPLRLLRTTMNKHKPKFMKVVPPGQQKGTIAPPYAWEPRERDDWRYNLGKPIGRIGEGEFDVPGRPAPSTATVTRPAAGPAKPRDPRHARVDAIQAELRQLHQEIAALVQQKKMRPKAPSGSFTGVKGGGSVATGGDFPIDFEPLNREKARSKALGHKFHQQVAPRIPKPQRDIGFNVLRNRPALRHRGLVASLDLHRAPLRLVEAISDSEYGAFLLKAGKSLRNQQRRDKVDLPLGAERSQGPADPIDQQIEQKRRRIKQLTFELQMLRRQLKTTTESTGISRNNLHRLSLLLK